jgi:hypothetical protein
MYINFTQYLFKHAAASKHVKSVEAFPKFADAPYNCPNTFFIC